MINKTHKLGEVSEDWKDRMVKRLQNELECLIKQKMFVIIENKDGRIKTFGLDDNT